VALPRPPLERAMNLLNASVLILSGLLVLQVIFVGAQSKAVEGANIVIPETEIPAMKAEIIPLHAIALEPMEVTYPEPTTTPTMRPYQINKDHDIWHASDPASYIEPDNEWVKYFASKLYIDYDGRLRYKNKTVPLRVDTKGNILQWTDEPFLNTYVSDNDQFHYPPNEDVWVMPQYYLTHGMKDDCDGWMVTVTSMMQSGELSIKENSSFVKKVIPSKAVLGYMGGYRDGWTEYKAYGKTYLTTTALVSPGFNEKRSATEFIEKKDKTTARPVFEFDNKHFGNYKQW
jgi:hypothetical protein